MRGRLVVNSLPLSLDAALRGGGIVRLPAPFAAEEVKSGALVELLAPYAQPARPFFVVYPGGVHTPPRVRAFIEVAMKHLDL